MKMPKFVAGVICINLFVGLGIVPANADDKNIDACFAYRNGQDYPNAIRSGKAAIKSSPKSWDSHMCLGSAYYLSGEITSALKELKIAESLATDKGQLAATASYLSSVYDKTGDKEESLKECNRELSLRREIGEPNEIATALNNAGAKYGDSDQPDKAIEYYKEAIKIQPDELKTARMYLNIASALSKQKKYDEADLYLTKAMVISEKAGNSREQAACITSLGYLQYLKKDYKKAESTYIESLKRIRALGDASSEAEILQNLGWNSEALGLKTQAADYYKQALAIFTRVGNKLGVAEAKNDLADLQ